MLMPSLSLLLALLQPTSGTVNGYWEGAMFRDNSLRLISADFREGQLTLHSNDWGWNEPAKTEFKQDNSDVTFTFGGQPVRLTLDAWRHELVGTMGAQDPLIRVHLKRTTAPSPAAVKREDVTVKHEEVTLAGSLTMPPGPGKHPVILLLPGRGATVREGRRKAEIFAQHGFGMLSLDARGYGSSTGSKDSNIRDKIADGIAAVKYLASRDDVDPKKVGLLAHSAGAWVAPFVAVDAQVAYMVTTVGPTESVEQQQLSTFELYLKRSPKKLTEAEVAEGMDFVRSWLAHAIGGADRKPVDEKFKVVSKSRYAEEAEATEAALADNIDWVRRHSIDPAEALMKLKIPILAVYGGTDWVVEAARNDALLRKYSVEAGNRKIRVEVLEGAGHGLMMAPEQRQVEGRTYYAWSRMHPDVPGLILEWLKEQVR